MGCGASSSASSASSSAAVYQPSPGASGSPTASSNATNVVQAPQAPPPSSSAAHEPAPAPTTTTSTTSSSLTLRIIAVNDVYELGNLPRLKTAVAQLKTDNTIFVLAGDFLAPSLLSSLDHGRGMVDVLNDCGLQYVCLGNHEQDVAHKHLLQRMDESKFVWINTNAPTLPLEGREPLPEFVTVDVEAKGEARGTHARKVSLLGLNTGDPGLYTDKAWGGVGAKCMAPIVPSARSMREKLAATTDLVIPMTHQVMPLDREMAETCGAEFPLIIGGHDHQPYLETVNGCIITKQGADAALVGVIDVTWLAPEHAGASPTIDVQQLPITNFEPDKSSEELVEKHKHVLKALDEAILCEVPQSVPLNSKGIRLAQTTMGSLICTSVREALFADCAIINAGNIRGNTTYGDNHHYLTYSDLKAEVPFDSPVAVVNLPGAVLQEVVAFTRQFALHDPPVEKGCFVQLDDKMSWDGSTNTLTAVAGGPFDPERIYKTVVLYQVAYNGIDGVTPLANYVSEHLKTMDDPTLLQHSDSAHGMKQILVEHFARAVWWQIVKDSGFDDIDEDGSGTISRKELEAAIFKRHGVSMGNLVLDNLMALADTNGDGNIDRGELLRACFLSSSMFYNADEDMDSHVTKEEAHKMFQKIMTSSYDPKVVDDLFTAADSDGSGTVSMDELHKYATRQDKSVTI
ncbi:EF-hand domain-containing protein [Pseudoscourfieldia marina]